MLVRSGEAPALEVPTAEAPNAFVSEVLPRWRAHDSKDATGFETSVAATRCSCVQKQEQVGCPRSGTAEGRQNLSGASHLALGVWCSR